MGTPAPCVPADPAQVTTMLPETHLPKGMRGVIRCPSRANPPLLSVTWTRDGHPLELDKVRPLPPPTTLPTFPNPSSSAVPLSQLPGWSVRPDGSIVIATGNDDALGLYRCTPYNSYGTAGESRPTRVLLKVRSPPGSPPWLCTPCQAPHAAPLPCRTLPPSRCGPRRNISRRWAGSW